MQSKAPAAHVTSNQWRLFQKSALLQSVRFCGGCVEEQHVMVQDIAAKIGDVLRPYSKGSRVGLDTRDRLQRVLKQTQPIATTDLRPLSTQEGPTENGDAHLEPPLREDPMRLRLSPSWQVSVSDQSSLIPFSNPVKCDQTCFSCLLGCVPLPCDMHQSVNKCLNCLVRQSPNANAE